MRPTIEIRPVTPLSPPCHAPDATTDTVLALATPGQDAAQPYPASICPMIALTQRSIYTYRRTPIYVLSYRDDADQPVVRVSSAVARPS
jgi:hypothetical protein